VSVIGIAIFQFAFTCEGYMPSECNLPSPFSTQLGSFHFTEDRVGVRRPQGSWGNFVRCSAFDIRGSQVHGEVVLRRQGM
jgi:hypothetical protein